MSRIKICGLRRPEDIAAVNEARPDYCGFIVEYPKSRRSIDRATLRELVQGLREEIVPVGVFVNAPKELVADLLEEGTIQIAQLHGQESQEYIQELKVLTEKPLIQAFSIKSKEDVERARESAADYLRSITDADVYSTLKSGAIIIRMADSCFTIDQFEGMQ